MATIVQEEIGTSGLINQENYDKNSIPMTSMSRSSKEITHGNLLGRNLEEGTAGETSADDIAPENATEERIYPHGFRLALLTVALLLATFVTALDTAIIGDSTRWLRIHGIVTDKLYSHSSSKNHHKFPQHLRYRLV